MALWKDLDAEAIADLSASITRDTTSLIDSLASLPACEAFSRLINGPWTKANVASRCKFLDMVSPDESTREAAEKARVAIVTAKRSVFSSEKVYNAVGGWLRDVADGKLDALDGKCGPDPSLAPVFARGLLRKFDELGLFGVTDSEKRRRGIDILSEITDVENAWKKDLTESVAKAKLLIDESRLSGVPDHTLATMKKNAENESIREVLLTYPHVTAVLGFCEDRETRKTVYEAFKARGGAENEARMLKLSLLRKEFASLKGLDSFADVVQAGNRMAGSATRVSAFLDELDECTREAGREEKEKLTAFAKDTLGLADFGPWDSSFAFNKFKNASVDVDMREVNKYFPAEHAIPAMIKIYEELLSLRIEADTDADDKWHEDVDVYRVHDKNSGDFLGTIYLDLWPREGKYGHACVVNLIDTPHDADAVNEHDCTVMVCNLAKEMSHGDVVTAFHETGHLMHNICGRNGSKSAFAKVPRDFVECPSQMLENWCFEDVILTGRLSKHVDTGASIPPALASKLKNARYFMAAMAVRRQLQFAQFDLFLHGADPPSSVSEIAAKEKELVKIMNDWNIDGSFSSMARNFGHTASQYSASYYGYLWSEVFSADFFVTVFTTPESLTDPVKGAHYRKCILHPGGTKTGDEMIRNFLGRDANIDAFLKGHGFKK